MKSCMVSDRSKCQKYIKSKKQKQHCFLSHLKVYNLATEARRYEFSSYKSKYPLPNNTHKIYRHLEFISHCHIK